MYITVCTNWSRVAPYVEAVQTNWCICLNIHLWGWISNPIYFWIHFFVRFTCLICSIQNKSCSLCLSGGPKLLFTLTAEEQRGRGGINKDRRQHLYHTGRFSTKKGPWQPTICQPFLSNRATPMNWCLQGRNRDARRMSVWQFLMANSLCWISLIIFNTCAPLWQ